MNEKAIGAIKSFLEALGIDLTAAGMEKTPERVANMYEFLFNGLQQNPQEVWGERFHSESHGLIAVQNIPFYSMCEHHLVPFFGSVYIAYIPHDGYVAGFSKFVKLVEIFSHRPQIQERMTMELADEIEKGLGAEGVMVVIEAQQLCMTMRGDLAQGTKTITSECRGLLYQDQELHTQALMMLMNKKEE